MIIPELDQAVGQLRDIAVLVKVNIRNEELSEDIEKIADRLNEVLNAIL